MGARDFPLFLYRYIQFQEFLVLASTHIHLRSCQYFCFSRWQWQDLEIIKPVWGAVCKETDYLPLYKGINWECYNSDATWMELSHWPRTPEERIRYEKINREKPEREEGGPSFQLLPGLLSAEAVFSNLELHTKFCSEGSLSLHKTDSSLCFEAEPQKSPYGKKRRVMWRKLSTLESAVVLKDIKNVLSTLQTFELSVNHI